MPRANHISKFSAQSACYKFPFPTAEQLMDTHHRTYISQNIVMQTCTTHIPMSVMYGFGGDIIHIAVSGNCTHCPVSERLESVKVRAGDFTVGTFTRKNVRWRLSRKSNTMWTSIKFNDLLPHAPDSALTIVATLTRHKTHYAAAFVTHHLPPVICRIVGEYGVCCVPEVNGSFQSAVD